jgi:hypothetical protein
VPWARLHTRHILREWRLADIADDAELVVAELVIPRGGLWQPSLVVSNPAVAARTSEIIAESGWFWWDARRLCEITCAERAARLIISVLRMPEPG